MVDGQAWIMGGADCSRPSTRDEPEAVIPRYFLHYWDGDGLDEDHRGMDLDAAHLEALRLVRKLRQLWSDLPSEVRNDLAFEIADGSGQMVLTVPFSEAECVIH
jgi:hypothetical protein